MVIEGQQANWFVHCDVCSNFHEFEKDIIEFNEVVAELRKLGWQSKKKNDEWIHICPVCVEFSKS